MRNYGGGSPWKDALFAANFATISGITTQIYAVAGFTEVRNNMAGQNFANRALNLDAGLTSWILYQVGITAVGRQAEYLGIAWDPNEVVAQHAGVVVYNAMLPGWQCYNNAGAPPPPLWVLPTGAAGAYIAADSRGLAYIAGVANGGANCIFAFMHNMYNLGNRTGAFNNLNTMITTIAAAIGWVAPYQAYVGGDFNIPPRDPTPGGNLHHAAAVNTAGTAYRKTTYANAYDFWLSNQGLPHARATVWKQTRNSGASDHSGIKFWTW
jgi:hypothetical protein